MGRNFKIYLEFMSVLFLKYLMILVPWKFASLLGSTLGYLAKFFLSFRRKLVLKNIIFSFPDKSLKEILKISNGCWKNIGSSALEFAKIPTLNKKNIYKYLEVIGEEKIKNSLKKNRGIILLTAHLGNWELIGPTLCILGYEVMGLVRAMENQFTDKIINRIRTSKGGRIVYDKNWKYEVLKHLKENKIFEILIDQKIMEGSILTTFFSRPALTSPILPILHKRTKADIIPVYAIRTNNKMKIFIENPLKLETDIHNATETINKIIENWIRMYPQDWFWVHNRWEL